MKICKNSVVTLDYSVTDTAGNLIDGGAHPIVYLHGGYDGVFAKIEATLEGKEIGYSADIELMPKDAFGDYDDDLVEVEDRSVFTGDIEVGMQFSQGEDEEDGLLYVITQITDDKVVLDANHPFAGLFLKFSCTVTGVRDATAEELSARSAIV